MRIAEPKEAFEKFVESCSIRENRGYEKNFPPICMAKANTNDGLSLHISITQKKSPKKNKKLLKKCLQYAIIPIMTIT